LVSSTPQSIYRLGGVLPHFLFAITTLSIALGILAFSARAQQCTQEAKVCPDGSTVERVGPNCEFAACPAAAPAKATPILTATLKFSTSTVSDLGAPLQLTVNVDTQGSSPAALFLGYELYLLRPGASPHSFSSNDVTLIDTFVQDAPLSLPPTGKGTYTISRALPSYFPSGYYILNVGLWDAYQGQIASSFLKVGNLKGSYFLTLNGARVWKGNQSLGVSEGPGVAPGDPPLFCKIALTHTIGPALKLTPVVSVFRRTNIPSNFVSRFKAPETTIRKGETKTISIELPIPAEPQSYLAVVDIQDPAGQRLAPEVNCRWVVIGPSGTIANVTFDKPTYRKGDTLHATVTLFGSADLSLPHHSATDAQGEPSRRNGVASISVADQSGTELGNANANVVFVGDEVQMPTLAIELPKVSKNMTVTTRLSVDGQDVASRTDTIHGSSPLALIIYSIALLLLIVLFAGYRLFSKKNLPQPPSALTVLFLVVPLVLAIAFFLPGAINTAYACHDCNCSRTLSWPNPADGTHYPWNGIIGVTWGLSSSNCLNMSDSGFTFRSYIDGGLTCTGYIPQPSNTSPGTVWFSCDSYAENYNPGAHSLKVTIDWTYTNCGDRHLEGTRTIYIDSPPALYCSPPNQTVQTNQNASFSASGGIGSYSWSATDGNPSAGSGASFGTTYSSAGAKSVSVSSREQLAVCNVNVTSPPPPPPSCGNHTLDPGEQCDNGVENGACPATCSPSCTVNNCVGNPPPQPPPPGPPPPPPPPPGPFTLTPTPFCNGSKSMVKVEWTPGKVDPNNAYHIGIFDTDDSGNRIDSTWAGKYTNETTVFFNDNPPGGCGPWRDYYRCSSGICTGVCFTSYLPSNDAQYLQPGRTTWARTMNTTGDTPKTFVPLQCPAGRNHLECINNTCSSVSGGGPDACSPAGSTCSTHFACEFNSCVSRPGAGTDACSTVGASCTSNNHLECANNTCVGVSGPGANTCTSLDSSCVSNNHLECSNNTCVGVSGPGANTCSPAGSSCVSNNHLECANNTCVGVSGPGANTCSPAGSSCAGNNHLVCRDNSCVSIPTSGSNRCTPIGSSCVTNQCNDGYDNDRDGLIDDQDPDCANSGINEGTPKFCEINPATGQCVGQ
jgi:hypothetical protein